MIDPTDLTRLDGRAALVTGATRGIGRAIAEGLGAAGASVCVTARKPDAVEAAVTELRAAGVDATGHVGSAGDPDAIADGVAHCMAVFGRVDVLVNNAATNPQYGPLAEADLGAVDKVWQVNVRGPLRYAQAVWAAWMGEHGGVILNVASLAALRAEANLGAYNLSKAALAQLTRQLALEMAPGVRVNTIAPGLIKTDMSRVLWEGGDTSLLRQPLGFVGDPDDVAGLAVFLASPAARYITGDLIVVDGGLNLT